MLTPRQQTLQNLHKQYFHRSCDIDFSLPENDDWRQIHLYESATLAIHHNKIDILDLLFEEGLSLKRHSMYDYLLVSAIKSNHIELVNYFLKKNHPLFWDDSFLFNHSISYQIRYQATFNCALSLAIHLHHSFNIPNLPIIELLLEYDPDYTYYHQEKYRHNVLLAIATNQTNHLLTLFEKKGMNIHIDSNDVAEIVNVSCLFNNFTMVEHFVEKDISLDQQEIIVEYCANKHLLSYLDYFLSIGFASTWMETLSMNPQAPQFEKMNPEAKKLIIELFNRKKLKHRLLDELPTQTFLPQLKI